MFPSLEAATAAVKPLTGKIGTNGLRFVRESFGMKYQAAALAGIQRNQYEWSQILVNLNC